MAILHLRGHYFAIGSLVVADVLREVTNSWIDLTGGGMGLNLPLPAAIRHRRRGFFLLAMSALAAVAAIASVLIARSKLGVALRCIEQNEDAAQVIGSRYAPLQDHGFRHRRACSRASPARSMRRGCSYIDPTDVYDISLSVKPIIMALLGGVGTIAGPIIGAFVFLALEEVIWRNSLEFHAGILGILVVLLVLVPAARASGRSAATASAHGSSACSAGGRNHESAFAAA